MSKQCHLTIHNNYKLRKSIVWLQTIDLQQKITFCSYFLLMVLVLILDYLCPNHIVKQDSSQTQVEIYNGIGAKVVKDPHPNQIRQSQRFFCLWLIYRLCRMQITIAFQEVQQWDALDSHLPYPDESVHCCCESALLWLKPIICSVYILYKLLDTLVPLRDSKLNNYATIIEAMQSYDRELHGSDVTSKLFNFVEAQYYISVNSSTK